MGIVHVDTRGRFLRANRRLCEMLGYSHDELLQRTVMDVTHPDDRRLSSDGLEQLASGERHTFSLEKRYVRKDGSHVWGRITVALVPDQNGRPDYYSAIVEDITHYRDLEANLREAQSNLTHQLAELNHLYARSRATFGRQDPQRGEFHSRPADPAARMRSSRWTSAPAHPTPRSVRTRSAHDGTIGELRTKRRRPYAARG